MAEASRASALKTWFEELPFGGEFHPAPQKKFQETLLVVPFYGGRKPQMRRHVEFLNELGFDVVDFEFELNFSSIYDQVYSPRSGLGFKHVWADQVEALLNTIPGQKIVYACSNPASGAVEAIARRKASDVTALICDGGPTDRFWDSIVKYFTTETPLPLKPARWAMATLLTPLWSPRARLTLHEDLEQFPDAFPLLSVRGWKDHLIPPKDIDEVFEPHTQLDWQKLSLPEAGHLNGLKDFPDEYVPAVTRFLKAYAHKI